MSDAKNTVAISLPGTPALFAYEANTFFSRLRGLHAHLPLDDNEALVIRGCHSIHTMTMSHPIDVAFISERGEVLKVETVPVKRWASDKKATSVVEANAGVLLGMGMKAGMILERDSGEWT